MLGLSYGGLLKDLRCIFQGLTICLNSWAFPQGETIGKYSVLKMGVFTPALGLCSEGTTYSLKRFGIAFDVVVLGRKVFVFTFLLDLNTK